MKTIFAFLLTFIFVNSFSHAAPQDSRALEYRALVLKILKSSQFKVSLPGDLELPFSYSFEWGNPMSDLPKVVDFRSSEDRNKITYIFVDRILLTPASRLVTGKTTLPLTCVFVRGSDRRLDPKPNSPSLILDVYVVAGDPECNGPTPDPASKEESWDNYVRFFVSDLQSFKAEKIIFKYQGNLFRSQLSN